MIPSRNTPQTINAIVLKKTPYGEGDLIITFLTEEGSRFTGFAPSARRSQKRFGGCLDLFNYLTVQFKESGEMARLESTALIRGMEGVRSNLTKFAVTCYFAELILEFLPEKEKSPDLFRSFYGFLESLEGPEELPLHHVPLMEHQLLELFGFKPTLTHCLGCNASFKGQNTCFFNGTKGGVMCKDCADAVFSAHPGGDVSASYPLSASVIGRICSEKATDPREWNSDSWQPQEVLDARRAFEYFIQYTAGKPLKSLQFLSQILS